MSQKSAPAHDATDPRRETKTEERLRNEAIDEPG
jgi:hypothetical protein